MPTWRVRLHVSRREWTRRLGVQLVDEGGAWCLPGFSEQPRDPGRHGHESTAGDDRDRLPGPARHEVPVVIDPGEIAVTAPFGLAARGMRRRHPSNPPRAHELVAVRAMT